MSRLGSRINARCEEVRSKIRKTRSALGLCAASMSSDHYRIAGLATLGVLLPLPLGGLLWDPFRNTPPPDVPWADLALAALLINSEICPLLRVSRVEYLARNQLTT